MEHVNESVVSDQREFFLDERFDDFPESGRTDLILFEITQLVVPFVHLIKLGLGNSFDDHFGAIYDVF
jgi:hypothetical protein